MRMPLTLLAPGLAALLLAGCEDPPAPEIRNEPPAGSPPEVAWSTNVGASGVELVLQRPGIAGPDHHISFACSRIPGRFHAIVRGVAPIGSEDRLTVGFDDQAFALVVDPATLQGERPLDASGPITPELIGALERASTVSAVYGATEIGPFAAPRDHIRAGFAQACREMAEGAAQPGSGA